ncbi:hypothetical protein Curi_c12700 [Gottschalkia acidurici 9a]|uniref:Uncharacterized protein n=2 Tax=Clostridium acidurici TaxID=1556 RepID=K0B0V9_GOTA9|nr:hypothetical protein Curi_c12700 [Gottschalkia acidurici 9a]
MGFLVAMVAPRLEGIGSKASGTVDDGSTKIIETTLSRYLNENNKLPNKLGNLAPAGATAGQPLAKLDNGKAGSEGDNKMIWDGTKTMGKIATFDKSFADKTNYMFMH